MPFSVICVKDFMVPQVLAVKKDFLIIYKPPRMHSAPLSCSSDETLIGWCSKEFPETIDLPGRKEGEGGLLHRLDYETQGLMLVARNTKGMKALLEQQKNGKIKKEYSALVTNMPTLIPGFPPFSGMDKRTGIKELKGMIIESAFRSYGRGRKEVRPVPLIDGESQNRYITRVIDTAPVSTSFFSFCLEITKGFRHQIRSHLSWIGYSIVNDKIYGVSSYGRGFLSLRASSLVFSDPLSGRELLFSIPPISPEEI